jgi:hypothetical protein
MPLLYFAAMSLTIAWGSISVEFISETSGTEEGSPTRPYHQVPFPLCQPSGPKYGPDRSGRHTLKGVLLKICRESVLSDRDHVGDDELFSFCVYTRPPLSGVPANIFRSIIAVPWPRRSAPPYGIRWAYDAWGEVLIMMPLKKAVRADEGPRHLRTSPRHPPMG